MPRNVYSEINLHLTWHTLNSAPMLTGDIESHVHRSLKDRALSTKGVFVHAVNGIADHVHMVVTIPPTILISDWIGDLKGSSSFHINQRIANRHVLDWQAGYGVVSFGTKDLPWVISYVERQKEHHAHGTIQDRLERIEFDEAR
jgi:REP element-mobilizing transposase RayT